jgi:hypothetical protein
VGPVRVAHPFNGFQTIEIRSGDTVHLASWKLMRRGGKIKWIGQTLRSTYGPP